MENSIDGSRCSRVHRLRVMLGDCKIDHWPVREDIHYRLRRSHVQRMICLPVPGTLRAAAPAAATAGYGPFVGKWRCIGQLRCCWSVLLPCHKSPRLKWQGPRVHLQDAMTTPSARRVDLYAVIMIIAAVFKASYSTSELRTTGRDPVHSSEHQTATILATSHWRPGQ